MLQPPSPSALLPGRTVNCFSGSKADWGLNSKYPPLLLSPSRFQPLNKNSLQPNPGLASMGLITSENDLCNCWSLFASLHTYCSRKGKYWNTFEGNVLTFSGTGRRYKMGSFSVGTTCGFPSFLCTLFSKLHCVGFPDGLNVLLIWGFCLLFTFLALSLFYFKSSLSSVLFIGIWTNGGVCGDDWLTRQSRETEEQILIDWIFHIFSSLVIFFHSHTWKMFFNICSTFRKTHIFHFVDNPKVYYKHP